METLIISEQEAIKLAKLKEYAETHKLTTDDLLDIINNPALSPGIIPEHQIKLPLDFKVVYSIDEVIPGRFARHLSVSRDKPNVLPSPHSIAMIMERLGFINTLKNCKISEEKLEPGYTAINIGELID